MTKKLLLLAFLICSPLWATNYYLRADGTAANKGAATGPCATASATMSMATHNAETFSGDDTIILCNDGGTFRSQLTVPSSGSVGHLITYAKGQTAVPIISGADVFASWTPETGTVPPPTLLCHTTLFKTTTVSCVGNIATSGSLLILTAFSNSGKGVTVSDTKSNAWLASSTVPTVTSKLQSGSNFAYTFYVAVNNGSGSDTFTFTVGSSDGLMIVVAEWSVPAASPLDGMAHLDVQTSGATADSGASSGSGANLNDLVYAQCTANKVLSVGTDFTSLYGTTWQYLAEYKIGAGNSHGICGLASSGLWSAQVVTFKASAGAVSTLYYAGSVPTRPTQVFRDSARLTLVASKLLLVPGSWWWDATNSRIYVYDNPAGHTIKASQRNYAIYGVSKSYVTVQDIEADETQIYGVYFNGTGNILVQRVTAQYNFTNGFRYDDCSISIFRSVTAAYNGANGIGAYASPDLLIELSTVHHNAQLLDTNYTAGIKLNGLGSTNVTIQNNISYSNGIAGMAGSRGAGIWADTVGAGLVTKYNLTYLNHMHGIFHEADSGSVIEYNVSYSNAGAGLDFSGAALNGNLMYNNVSNGNGSDGIRLVGSGVPGSAVNNAIINNISTNNVPNLRAIGGGENDGTNGSGNVYTDNCLGPEATHFIAWGAETYNTYADWETAYGGTTHSVEEDPLFINAAGGDFRLSSTSPAINAGTNLGTTYQLGLDNIGSFPWTLVNQSLYGNWEIGAFVYPVRVMVSQ